jgi:prolyl-tRNA editing enzyme YbaK/EbsC (Cys-tRNA(Pro) deacylase)
MIVAGLTRCGRQGIPRRARCTDYRVAVEKEWPDAVERVATYLRAAGAEARLEEFATPTPTAEAAARAAGCETAEIVKSLVVLCDGRPVLALVPGDRRADFEKIRRGAGAAIARIASPTEVGEATGFMPGGVAPFPLREGARVLIERTLLARPAVWVGAGSPNHMVRLDPAELVRLTRGEAMDVVEEPAYHSQPDTDRKEP